MNDAVQTAAGSHSLNAAFFDAGEAAGIATALASLPQHPRVVVSDRAGALRPVRAALRLSCAEIGLDRDVPCPESILANLRRWLTQAGPVTLVVDMRWLARMRQGASAIETWGTITEGLVGQGIGVVSFYTPDLLIDEQVQASFRAHRQFLAPSGLQVSPWWMPPEMRSQPLGEQLSWLLGRVVPDYAGQAVFARDDRFAAHGAAPDWLGQAREATAEPRADAWQIYCLGQLRVYRGGERLDWKQKGGAPKKTRTLFAYLLTKGETGAHADRLAELLWPGDGDEEGKRSRLHHTVAMLRKTLGDAGAVLRSGDYYRLNAPQGSWTDTTSFEQLCRRGMSLSRRGQRAEALEIYRAAEALYGGPLFQDLPEPYLDDGTEDWCLPRRVWLQETALKLQCQMAALLREEGRLRAALAHCQKAESMDPLSEDAAQETLRVYHAQGRPDAMARHYRQYRKALEGISASVEGSEVQALYLALTRR